MPASIAFILSPTILALLTGIAPPAPSAPVPAPAPAVAPAPSAAGVLRYEPANLDLGEMLLGSPKSMTLAITNASGAPIEIASIKGGCGCTTVSAPPAGPIAPGASFSVEITLDPGKKAGVELVKPLHVVLADGRIDTTQIRARVKVVVSVSPEAIDLSREPRSADSIVLESVDGAAFRILGATPAGVLRLPRSDEAAKRFELSLDRAAFEAAGRPSSILIATDRDGARELAVPVKAAEAVALFRLPPAAPDAADRTALEAAQDGIVRTIDEGLPSSSRSERFRMRLHRESGMLFVHGSESEVAAIRAAVRALPTSSGVRESHDAGGA